MKIATIAVAVIAIATTAGANWQSQQTERTISSRKVTKENRQLFIQSFMNMKAAKLKRDLEKRPKFSFEVLQMIAPKEYLAVIKSKNGTTMTCKINVLREPDGGYIDGAAIIGDFEKQKLPYRYTAVSGATKGVAVYHQTREPEPIEELTKEQFLAFLKAGGSWTVVYPRAAQCQTCRGFRRITDDSSGRRAADGKRPCPSCGATGRVSLAVTVVW